MLAIDHVLIVTRDPKATAARLAADHGLASVPGGRHVGHGTANVIVPLGAAYLELVFVADETEASESPFGRWVSEMARTGADRPAGWCARTDDIDSVAARLGLDVTPMSRARPDDPPLAWRLGGLDEVLGTPLPFFIEWQVAAADHPGRSIVPHQVEPIGIAWLEVGATEPRLDVWLGPHELDLRPTGGPSILGRIGIETATGTIVA